MVTQAVNTGTDIYHSSASKINPDGSVTTDVYIIKDGSWQNLPLRMMVEKHIPMMMM